MELPSRSLCLILPLTVTMYVLSLPLFWKRAPSRIFLCYMTKYVTVLLDSYSKVVLNFFDLAASLRLFAYANKCSKVGERLIKYIYPPSPHFRLWSTYSEQMIRRLCKLKLYSIPGTRRTLRSCILSIQPTSSESWWPYSNLSLGMYAVCVICIICNLSTFGCPAILASFRGAWEQGYGYSRLKL